MNSSWAIVIKVLGLSAVLAIALKYTPALAVVPPTLPVVLTLVLLPTVLLAAALSWRSQTKA